MLSLTRLVTEARVSKLLIGHIPLRLHPHTNVQTPDPED
jgi:hypothetical protein